MKKLLIKFGLFFLPIILLVYPLDLFLSNGLRHSSLCSGELEVWNDIYSSNINEKCLIYGSSRAWVHIDPAIIEKETGISSYNLGMDAHNFYLQYLRHKKLLEYNQRPSTILYSLDMATLQRRADLYNDDQFLPFMLWDKEIRETTDKYIGFQPVDYFVPLVRYISRFDAIKSGIKYYIDPDTRFRYKGYKGMEWKWNNDFDNAKAKMDKYTVVLDTMSVRMFEDFLKECQTNKTSLIFIYSPEYIEGQEFVSNRSEIIDMYKKWSEEYQIPFFDYSNDSICYDKAYFYNAMHMNKEGAELFTKKLSDDLKHHKLLTK